MNNQHNSKVAIRLATIGDLEALEPVFKAAKEFMTANGNPTQWAEDGPTTFITASRAWLIN